MITPRDTDVEKTATELPAKSFDRPHLPASTRAASQRRAMQAAMAAAVRSMRTPGVRATAERAARTARQPPTEA